MQMIFLRNMVSISAVALTFSAISFADIAEYSEGTGEGTSGTEVSNAAEQKQLKDEGGQDQPSQVEEGVEGEEKAQLEEEPDTGMEGSEAETGPVSYKTEFPSVIKMGEEPVGGGLTRIL